jgi:hypothetical protein
LTGLGIKLLPELNFVAITVGMRHGPRIGLSCAILRPAGVDRGRLETPRCGGSIWNDKQDLDVDREQFGLIQS